MGPNSWGSLWPKWCCLQHQPKLSLLIGTAKETYRKMFIRFWTCNLDRSGRREVVQVFTKMSHVRRQGPQLHRRVKPSLCRLIHSHFLSKYEPPRGQLPLSVELFPLRVPSKSRTSTFIITNKTQYFCQGKYNQNQSSRSSFVLHSFQCAHYQAEGAILFVTLTQHSLALILKKSKHTEVKKNAI